MNILILLKLLAAHVIGDFFLQPDTICKGKSADGFQRFVYLAIHSAINAFFAYFFVGFWDCWMIAVIVFSSHFIIDFIKTFKVSKPICVFIIDQIAHIAVIIGLWLWLTDASLNILCSWWDDKHIWIIVLCYLLALKPASILLGKFIAKWASASKKKGDLPNAGAWIGYFERILILTFMLVGCKEGIGFLLAAKSIFRFGELKNPDEVKITEYVMIGTLSSFTLAILLGIIALQVIK